MQILSYFFKPYKGTVIILIIASIIVGVLEAASVAVVYPILNTAFNTGIDQFSGVLGIFSRVAELLPVSDSFIAYCVLFLLLALFTFIIKVLFIRYKLKFSGNLVSKNQKEVYSRLVGADYEYFTEHKQGEMIFATITAPHFLQIFLNSATEIVTQIILLATVFVLLVSLSWQGTIVVLVLGLVYFIFTRFLSNRVAYDASKHQATAATQSTIIVNETIDGIKQIKAFQTALSWTNKFGRTISEFWYHYVRQYIWHQSLAPALVFLLYIAIGMTAVSIRLITPNSFTALIPIFGIFAFAAFRLMPIVNNATSAFMQLKASLPQCEIVYDLLTARLDTIVDGTKQLQKFVSCIEFENVSFGYGENQVFSGINAVFKKGKTTAIVGRSGSGKTTLINLLLRLYDVDSGHLKIDDIDIREITLSSWLDRIGYVSQDTIIFNDTIRNNITFGSNYSDEEITKAAESAHAHTFISALPQGYETIVGDRGIKLSGGQRQRIAVARAMVRNPEVLIFDEATNALDTISEVAVQRAIDEIAKSHTVIMIAHRLSTIINADKIIVLGGGRVLEEGTHEKLVEKKGHYWELCVKQSLL